MVAGLAAAWAATQFKDPRAGARIVFYGIVGSLALIAVLIGARLALAPGRVPRLPSWFLFLGAGLLFLAAIVHGLFLFVLPGPGYAVGGIVLGFAGGLGALRLALRSRRERPMREDGA